MPSLSEVVVLQVQLLDFEDVKPAPWWTFTTDGPMAPRARHFHGMVGSHPMTRRWPQVPEPVLQQLDAEPPGKTRKKMDFVGPCKSEFDVFMHVFFKIF